MRFKLFEELTEVSYETFNKIWNNVLPVELKRLNNYLDKYGFEVELVDEYDGDEELLSNSIGIFCSDIQDNASVFPVFIHKDAIYKCLEDEGFENDYSEIKYAIEGTLWHEAGHGIINYLWGEYEFYDDEETAEDFAQYKEDSELIQALQEWIDENSGE